MSTEIRLCGRLVVRLEGEDVEQSLTGRQSRLLFAYLTLSGMSSAAVVSSSASVSTPSPTSSAPV